MSTNWRHEARFEFSDSTRDLAELRVKDALCLLALGLRHSGSEKLARRAFVLMTEFEDRFDADAIEGAADEVLLPGKSDECDPASWLENDLVARARKVVGSVPSSELPEGVGESNRKLSRMPKP